MHGGVEGRVGLRACGIFWGASSCGGWWLVAGGGVVRASKRPMMVPRRRGGSSGSSYPRTAASRAHAPREVDAGARGSSVEPAFVGAEKASLGDGWRLRCFDGIDGATSSRGVWRHDETWPSFRSDAKGRVSRTDQGLNPNPPGGHRRLQRQQPLMTPGDAAWGRIDETNDPEQAETVGGMYQVYIQDPSRRNLFGSLPQHLISAENPDRRPFKPCRSNGGI